MEKQTVKKLSTLCFLAAGLLVWVSVGSIFRALAGSFGIVQQYYGMDLFRHGLPVTLGIAFFLYLQFSPKMLVWAENVILEVSKVVWPSRKDTVGMTIVVIIMVLISSVVLLAVDTVAREVIQVTLHLLGKYFA